MKIAEDTWGQNQYEGETQSGEQYIIQLEVLDVVARTDRDSIGSHGCELTGWTCRRSVI